MAVLTDETSATLFDQSSIALTDDLPTGSGTLALFLRFHMSIVLLVSLALT